MFRNLIILTFLLLLLLSKICSSSSADAACNRTCGSRTVAYPFGFSGSCPYLLNCSSGDDGSVLSIDGFPVLSFSNTSVQIRPFRNECYQNTSVLPGSFRGRFGISGQSVLLYYNCSTPLDHCLNVTGFKNTVAKENHGYCSPDVYLASRCLWNYGQGSWLLWDDLFKVRCRYLISGFVAKPAGQGSFDIQMNSLELLWWIPGHCSSGSCDDNARCVQFLNPVNDTVHRCSCRNGFLGDGFRQGDGCISSSSKKSRLAVRLLITFLIAASAIATATTILWKARRRVERSQGLGASADTDTPYDSLGVPVYSYESIEKATKFFADDQKLGSGAFGLVYAGKLSAGVPVAVKRMRYADERGVEQVLNEIRVLSRACHPHLVRLVGCCLERRDPILIYEHMPNGTLTEHLQGSRSPSPRPLPWNIRLRIAAESASALAYLHRDLNPPIFHRDVKSSNILLDHQLHCKVSDFGLSRLAGDASHISTAPQGTPGYLDPQYHSSFRLCDKSDVYSFGVVMAELLTGLKVLDFERQEADVSLACLVYARIATGRLDDILDPPLRTQANEDGQIRKQVWRVGELAFRCLAFDKNARPSMCEVSLDLHAVLHGDTNTASASASAFTPGVCSPLPSPRPAVSASS